MSPEERSMRARLAAHSQWANELDPTARTAKARKAADDRFIRQARERHPAATEAQIARAAEHLRKAHFQRMALASARSRRAKASKTAA